MVSDVMERIRATGDETSIIVVTGRSGQDLLPDHARCHPEIRRLLRGREADC